MARVIKNLINFYYNKTTVSTSKPSTSKPSSGSTSKPTTNVQTSIPSIDDTKYNELKKLISDNLTKINKNTKDVSTLYNKISTIESKLNDIKSCSCDNTTLITKITNLENKIKQIKTCECSNNENNENNENIFKKYQITIMKKLPFDYSTSREIPICNDELASLFIRDKKILIQDIQMEYAVEIGNYKEIPDNSVNYPPQLILEKLIDNYKGICCYFEFIEGSEFHFEEI